MPGSPLLPFGGRLYAARATALFLLMSLLLPTAASASRFDLQIDQIVHYLEEAARAERLGNAGTAKRLRAQVCHVRQSMYAKFDDTAVNDSLAMRFPDGLPLDDITCEALLEAGYDWPAPPRGERGAHARAMLTSVWGHPGERVDPRIELIGTAGEGSGPYRLALTPAPANPEGFEIVQGVRFIDSLAAGERFSVTFGVQIADDVTGYQEAHFHTEIINLATGARVSDFDGVLTVTSVDAFKPSLPRDLVAIVPFWPVREVAPGEDTVLPWVFNNLTEEVVGFRLEVGPVYDPASLAFLDRGTAVPIPDYVVTGIDAGPGAPLAAGPGLRRALAPTSVFVQLGPNESLLIEVELTSTAFCGGGTISAVPLRILPIEEGDDALDGSAVSTQYLVNTGGELPEITRVGIYGEAEEEGPIQILVGDESLSLVFDAGANARAMTTFVADVFNRPEWRDLLPGAEAVVMVPLGNKLLFNRVEPTMINSVAVPPGIEVVQGTNIGELEVEDIVVEPLGDNYRIEAAIRVAMPPPLGAPAVVPYQLYVDGVPVGAPATRFMDEGGEFLASFVRSLDPTAQPRIGIAVDPDELFTEVDGFPGDNRLEVYPFGAPQPPLFTDSELLGGSWQLSPWFGLFNNQLTPYLLHAEHGWLFVDPASTNTDAYLWDFVLDGWWFTGVELYPFMLDLQTAVWMEYTVGTGRALPEPALREFVDPEGASIWLPPSL